MPKPTLAAMIQKRWQLHDKLVALKAKAAAEQQPYEAALVMVETLITAHARENEITSQMTEFGGIARSHKKWANIKDFDAFLDWTLSQPNPKELVSAFVKHALKSTELHKFNQEHNQVPPGVELGGEFTYTYKR